MLFPSSETITCVKIMKDMRLSVDLSALRGSSDKSLFNLIRCQAFGFRSFVSCKGQVERLQILACDSLDNNAYTYVYASNSFIRRPTDWSIRLAPPSARPRG